MRPLKALFVSHSAGLGGAERVLLELLEGLDPEVVQATVVVPSAGPLAEAARRLSVPALIHAAPWWLPFESETSPHYAFRRYWEDAPTYVMPLARMIIDSQTDVVYSTSGVILHAALAAHVARRPHLQHMQDLMGWPHLGLHMPFGRARVAYRLLGRLSSLVVCVGRTIREDIGNAIPADRCRIVPLGVSPATPPATAMALPGTDGPTIRVGVVGAVERRKGAEVIAAVAQRVSREVPELHIYWAGAGDAALMTTLRQSSEINGVPHLHFLGYTDHVPDFMASMDFLLHPARNETFPRVLLEGAMAGRAIVATACGGGQEIVQDGVTGLVVDVDDVEGLAAAVSRLARDPDNRRRMGAAARMFASGFPLALYQAGMQQAVVDAHRRGPAVRGAVLPRLVDGLLALPAQIGPLVRRWSHGRTRLDASR